MVKKNKASADGRTAEVAHHARMEGGDEEVGAIERVEDELAAEPGHQAPLEDGEKDTGGENTSSEKSTRLSKENEVSPVKA
jgi:hypothetical protein